MKLKHIIILQNKIDLIRDSQAKDQYQEILKFVQGECVRRSLNFQFDEGPKLSWWNMQ